MSWTGYWMLKWRSANLPGSDAVLPRCQKLAEFLIARQAPDGQLMTRFREDGAVIQDTSRLLKGRDGAGRPSSCSNSTPRIPTPNSSTPPGRAWRSWTRTSSL